MNEGECIRERGCVKSGVQPSILTAHGARPYAFMSVCGIGCVCVCVCVRVGVLRSRVNLSFPPHPEDECVFPLLPPFLH